MKKQILAATIATVISMPTMADLLGLYAGVDYRTTTSSYTSDGQTFDFKDTNNLSGYVAFEHFVPLIPNIKLKYSDLSSEIFGEEESSSMLNGILYYQLLDTGIVEADFGLSYTKAEDFSEESADLVQAYAAAKIHVPGVGMHAFAEVVGGSITDDKATNAEGGVSYTFNPASLVVAVSVRAGYRYQEMIINDNTQENKGLFAGLEAHF